MPAPKRANTAAATEARRRIGLEKAAEKLRAAGWAVIPPKETTVSDVQITHRYPGYITIIQDGLDYLYECGACGDRVRGFDSRKTAEQGAADHECTDE